LVQQSTEHILVLYWYRGALFGSKLEAHAIPLLDSLLLVIPAHHIGIGGELFNSSTDFNLDTKLINSDPLQASFPSTSRQPKRNYVLLYNRLINYKDTTPKQIVVI
jgi:hypothetical protein